MPLRTSSLTPPKRIPLRNEDREIIKLGIYKCCGKKWKSKVIQMKENGKLFYVSRRQQVCKNKKCKRKVGPLRTRNWEQRWFGHFKCMAKKSDKRCGRTWKSSWTWTVNNQIQETNCKTCGTSTMPYQMVSSVSFFK